MPSITTLFALISLMFISGCSSFGLSSDVNNAAMLKSATTYEWGSESIAESSSNNKMQVLDAEIRERMNALMKNKGKTESTHADLTVNYKYQLDKTVTSAPVTNAQAQITLNSEGISYDPVNEGQPVLSLSGAIVISITDNKTQQNLYQAEVSNDDLNATTLDQLRAQLDRLFNIAERDIPSRDY